MKLFRNLAYGIVAKKNLNLVLIFLVIFWKSLIVISVKPSVISDSWEYVCYAKNLSERSQYRCFYKGDNPIFKNREFYFYRPYGYPIITSVFMRISEKYWLEILKFFQASLEVLVFALGLAYFSSNISKILWCLHTIFSSHWTPLVLTESLNGTFVFLTALLALKKSFFASLFLFMAVTIRQSAVLFLPLIFSSSKALSTFIVLVFASNLFWAYRNHTLCGEFTSKTTNFFRHISSDFGIDLASVVRAIPNKPCWEFEFNKQLRNRFVEKLSVEAVFQKYVNRFHNWFNLKKPFEIEFTLLKFSKMPSWIRSFLDFSFWTSSVLMLVSIITSILAFKILISSHYKPLFISVLSFLLLHPLLSPSNLRFLYPAGFISFFLFCCLIEKLTNSNKSV